MHALRPAITDDGGIMWKGNEAEGVGLSRTEKRRSFEEVSDTTKPDQLPYASQARGLPLVIPFTPVLLAAERLSDTADSEGVKAVGSKETGSWLLTPSHLSCSTSAMNIQVTLQQWQVQDDEEVASHQSGSASHQSAPASHQVLGAVIGAASSHSLLSDVAKPAGKKLPLMNQAVLLKPTGCLETVAEAALGRETVAEAALGRETVAEAALGWETVAEAALGREGCDGFR
jgi:hypothetical protein